MAAMKSPQSRRTSFSSELAAVRRLLKRMFIKIHFWSVRVGLTSSGCLLGIHSAVHFRLFRRNIFGQTCLRKLKIALGKSKVLTSRGKFNRHKNFEILVELNFQIYL